METDSQQIGLVSKLPTASSNNRISKKRMAAIQMTYIRTPSIKNKRWKLPAWRRAAATSVHRKIAATRWISETKGTQNFYHSQKVQRLR